MNKTQTITGYIQDIDSNEPFLVCGDSFELLSKLPSCTVDCIITSPPYWGHRLYSGGGIGLENTYSEYIKNLLKITNELYRVLKPTGSFWLNIGDTYRNKKLQGIPWRVAISLLDKQNWILRNSVIWNKHKGGLDSSKDKLRNMHENIFHFVKDEKNYFYDTSKIRSDARKSIVKNGSVISATGVSGIRYKRQIELSTSLNVVEKICALDALNGVLEKIKKGEIADFRMIIRGQQRATHSESEKVSGRAKELNQKGFYFLFYHPDGTLPGDVWEIIPEDTQKRKNHYAVYPEDLCKIPILATCPKNGIVLDPFSGSGTTCLVAYKHNRKSIGLDISTEYIEFSKERINEYKHENCGVLQLFDQE
ncbi:MAG: site-specific DNA-methyltransferase [Bacteroidota bacterium]|nr:site-specific DNA-methyltransferase [Odoribacter sp.]MDP3644101.1 site-specific DNA-methyltransferase [Bacteroidota bacterium]